MSKQELILPLPPLRIVLETFAGAALATVPLIAPADCVGRHAPKDRFATPIPSSRE